MLMLRKAALLVVGLAFSCAACAPDPSLLDAAALTPLLLSPEETGIPGVVEMTSREAEQLPVQLSVAMPLPDLESPCADAVQAGLDARFHQHASSSVGYIADEITLELGLFSVDEPIDAAAIYGDIVTECVEPIHDPVYDVTYAILPLDSEYHGMRVQITDGERRTREVIILQAEVADHWVLAGAHDLPEEQVTEIVRAQVAKLEAGLAIR